MELLERSSVASEQDQFKKYLNFYSVHSKTQWLVPCMNTAKKMFPINGDHYDSISVTNFMFVY